MISLEEISEGIRTLCTAITRFVSAYYSFHSLNFTGLIPFLGCTSSLPQCPVNGIHHPPVVDIGERGHNCSLSRRQQGGSRHTRDDESRERSRSLSRSDNRSSDRRDRRDPASYSHSRIRPPSDVPKRRDIKVLTNYVKLEFLKELYHYQIYFKDTTKGKDGQPEYLSNLEQKQMMKKTIDTCRFLRERERWTMQQII